MIPYDQGFPIGFDHWGYPNNRLIVLENNRYCFPLLFLKFNGGDLTFTGGGGLAKFSASGGESPPLGETLMIALKTLQKKSAPYPAVISYCLTGMGAQTKSTKSAQTLQEQKNYLFFLVISMSCFC